MASTYSLALFTASIINRFIQQVATVQLARHHKTQRCAPIALSREKREDWSIFTVERGREKE